MADNATKIIKITRANYEKMAVQGQSISKGGTTYTYDPTALYLIEDENPRLEVQPIDSSTVSLKVDGKDLVSAGINIDGIKLYNNIQTTYLASSIYGTNYHYGYIGSGSDNGQSGHETERFNIVASGNMWGSSRETTLWGALPYSPVNKNTVNSTGNLNIVFKQELPIIQAQNVSEAEEFPTNKEVTKITWTCTNTDCRNDTVEIPPTGGWANLYKGLSGVCILVSATRQYKNPASGLNPTPQTAYIKVAYPCNFPLFDYEEGSSKSQLGKEYDGRHDMYHGTLYCNVSTATNSLGTKDYYIHVMGNALKIENSSIVHGAKEPVRPVKLAPLNLNFKLNPDEYQKFNINNFGQWDGTFNKSATVTANGVTITKIELIGLYTNNLRQYGAKGDNGTVLVETSNLNILNKK